MPFWNGVGEDVSDPERQRADWLRRTESGRDGEASLNRRSWEYFGVQTSLSGVRRPPTAYPRRQVRRREVPRHRPLNGPLTARLPRRYPSNVPPVPTTSREMLRDDIWEGRGRGAQILTEVVIFVKHIRGRISQYVDFGHETAAYIERQKKARPDLAEFLGEMETSARAIDAVFARRKAMIRTRNT